MENLYKVYCFSTDWKNHRFSATDAIKEGDWCWAHDYPFGSSEYTDIRLHNNYLHSRVVYSVHKMDIANNFLTEIEYRDLKLKNLLDE